MSKPIKAPENQPEMSSDQMAQAIREITLEQKPSDLKRQFPKEYAKLISEIKTAKRKGWIVEIPDSF